MILGIGIDLLQVRRMDRWVDQPGLLARFFHPGELEDARRRGKSMALSLAVRYSAKEALGKAMGIGVQEFSLKEVQVVNNKLGKPEILLHGKALESLRRFGGSKIHLSLSHELDNAVAMVVIEG
ncbi:MAG: holo-ACP synthase [Spirochaetales bacterium]|nr:holo-ACP synthase [Spirochaetales bacterium]